MMNRIRHLSNLAVENIRILVIFISLILPITILFGLYPNSFQIVWEARTPYILFIWFFFLELVLSLRKPKNEPLSKRRTAAFLIVAAIPTLYVVATSFLGLNYAVTELGKLIGVPYETYGEWFIDVSWPISVEYLMFAASFTSTVFLVFGTYGLKKFLISIFFISSTTVFLMINTFAPYGVAGALQAFVPFTTTSAAGFLELLGFKTVVSAISNVRGPGMMLTVLGETSSFTAVVYWPSAGIQSLVIYTGMILLFIRDTSFTVLRKITYFVVGAAGTFMVNILRIASILIIGLRVGRLEANVFHDYFGEFFFISWMIVYLVLIVYGSTILNKITHHWRSN